MDRRRSAPLPPPRRLGTQAVRRAARESTRGAARGSARRAERGSARRAARRGAQRTNAPATVPRRPMRCGGGARVARTRAGGAAAATSADGRLTKTTERPAPQVGPHATSTGAPPPTNRVAHPDMDAQVGWEHAEFSCDKRRSVTHMQSGGGRARYPRGRPASLPVATWKTGLDDLPSQDRADAAESAARRPGAPLQPPADPQPPAGPTRERCAEAAAAPRQLAGPRRATNPPGGGVADAPPRAPREP